VLRRIFGPKRVEITREWRKQHNVKLNDLYSSPNIVRVIKLRRMRWAGHGREESHIQGFGRESWGVKDHLGDPGIDGRIILRWIFRK
jgi:hypothetical protein